MNTKVLMILIISVVVLAMIPVLAFKTTILHFEPTMTLEGFHEKFDDEAIVKHFKSKYPDHFSGRGKSPGMIMPAWGYGSVNESLIAELRVEENFGKYEFMYTCGNISEDVFANVMIKNPLPEDIDNNPCW